MDLEAESIRWLAGFAWTQITIDDGRALMHPAVFVQLSDYSCSLPSGTVIHKRWRCRRPYVDQPDGSNEWWLGEYAKHPTDPENSVAIIWREIWLKWADGTVERATNALLRGLEATEILAR